MDKCNVGVYPFVGRFILVVNLIKLNSMKNFDLEAAKAGAPVCTRAGFPARIICSDARNEEFPIVAMVFITHHDKETPQLYRTDGG